MTSEEGKKNYSALPPPHSASFFHSLFSGILLKQSHDMVGYDLLLISSSSTFKTLFPGRENLLIIFAGSREKEENRRNNRFNPPVHERVSNCKESKNPSLGTKGTR